MSSKPKLKLDWCSHEAAKYAVEKWHYSHSLPAGKMVKIGVWENDKFIGCVLFSYGANHNIGKPYGLVQTEVCELVRIALSHHKSKVSKIGATAIKLLKKQSPGIRLIVSYADTNQGHTGAIYQAMGWLYQGYFDGESDVVVNGRKMHRRQAYSLYGTTRPPGSFNVPAGGKHKYLMPLDDEIRKRIEPLRKPYPKKQCVTSIASDAPANHAGEGGATPTVTLSSQSP